MNIKIKDNLKNIISDNNMSVRELETKSGLKPSSVQNILNGRSKKPSSHTLDAICQFFNCTIEDLIGAESPELVEYYRSKKEKIEAPLEGTLLLDTVSTIIETIYKERINTSLEKTIPIIKEVYKYSKGKNSKKADKDFAQWVLLKKLL